MVKVNNVLWLTDFSADSTYALEYARKVAALFQAQLFLLHVIENPTSGIYGAVAGDYLAMEANARQKSREWLDEYVRGELKGVPRVEALVREGEVLSIILQTVKEKHIDTIVMGTHGRTGVAHLLLGSVTEKVIRSVHCPVYVIRHPDRMASAASAAA